MISILRATASFGELLQITSKIKSKSSLLLFLLQITDTAGLLASMPMSNTILLICLINKFKVATRQTQTRKWSAWSTILIRWASSPEATKFFCLSAVITHSPMLVLILAKWINWSNISTLTIGITSIFNTQPHPTSSIPWMPWESTGRGSAIQSFKETWCHRCLMLLLTIQMRPPLDSSIAAYWDKPLLLDKPLELLLLFSRREWLVKIN